MAHLGNQGQPRLLDHLHRRIVAQGTVINEIGDPNVAAHQHQNLADAVLQLQQKRRQFRIGAALSLAAFGVARLAFGLFLLRCLRGTVFRVLTHNLLGKERIRLVEFVRNRFMSLPIRRG